MAGPVYMLGVGKWKEAWYQRSEEERESYRAKVMEFRERDGVKSIFIGKVTMPGEWDWFGVEEYPDLEALHRHQESMVELGMPRYSKSKNIIASKWEPPS